jgi:NADH-ubiquinone oxidoreductase chain 5
MPRMGLSINFLPFTYICFFIGSLAILGIPFYTGFYSKDLLLELTWVRYTIDSSYVYFLALLTALLTAIYSMRLLLMVFFSGIFYYTNTYRPLKLQEVSKYMHFSLIVLCLASIMVGYFFSEIFSSIATPFWNSALDSQTAITLEQEYISPLIKALPVLLSLLGCALVFFFYELETLRNFNLKLHTSKALAAKLSNMTICNYGLNKISDFFYQAGYFNQVYNSLFLNFYKISYETFTKSIDKGYLEILGPYGLYMLFRYLSLSLKNIPSSLFFNVFLMFFFFSSLSFVLYVFSGLILLKLNALILPLVLFLIIYFKESKPCT